MKIKGCIINSCVLIWIKSRYQCMKIRINDHKSFIIVHCYVNRLNGICKANRNNRIVIISIPLLCRYTYGMSQHFILLVCLISFTLSKCERERERFLFLMKSLIKSHSYQVPWLLCKYIVRSYWPIFKFLQRIIKNK